MRLLILLLLFPVVLSAQRYEAEVYSAMKGIVVYTTTDGGKMVGSIEAGDWMEYKITVPNEGLYKITFRVAVPYNLTKMQIGPSVYGLPLTAGLENWTNVTYDVPLVAGAQTFRITSLSYRWNITWFEIGPPPTPKPVANAGSDFQVRFPLDTAILQGTGSNGVPEWRELQSGQNGYISNTAAWQPVLKNLYKAVYKYELSVTGPGGVARDTVVITAVRLATDPFAYRLPLGIMGYIQAMNDGNYKIFQEPEK